MGIFSIIANVCNNGPLCSAVHIWVRCYYVPDHYVPVCLKRPLVTKSLDSLRPLNITSLLKSLIWSLRPLYIMSPVWNVPGCLQFLYITSLDHYAPWSQCPLNTTFLEHNIRWTQRPCGQYIPDLFGHLYIYFKFFFSELHQPMDWLGIQPIHGWWSSVGWDWPYSGLG